MPAPTGVSVVIDGGAPVTSTVDVVLTIAATDADEMAFSNNGVDFSPFEIFATSKSFKLSDFGGGFQEGIRTVTLKVRDTFDNAEALATDTILLEVPEPRIEYQGNIPDQRTGTTLLDVLYTGFEDSIAAAPNVTLLDVEIDLSGTFLGSEVPLLEAVDDSLHDGRVGLAFSNSGVAHQYVGDLDKSFSNQELASDIARVRMRAQFGTKIGAFVTTAQFFVNLRSPIVAELTGRKTVPGQEIFLIGIFRDPLGALVDPDTPPDIEEILDPTGTDKLGGSTAAVRVSEGVYRHDFTPGLTDAVGQWSYRFNGDINGVTVRTQGFFVVADPPTLRGPTLDNGCVVFGDLVTADGKPLAIRPVIFTPHHLSEPEFTNPTSISTNDVRVFTDATGHFEVELARNTELVVYISDLNYRRFGKVPNQEIAEYKEIQLVLPTGVRDKFGNVVS